MTDIEKELEVLVTPGHPYFPTLQAGVREIKSLRAELAALRAEQAEWIKNNAQYDHVPGAVTAYTEQGFYSGNTSGGWDAARRLTQEINDTELISRAAIADLQNQLAAAVAREQQVRESCAVAAWLHYADVCKSKGLNPHHHGEWIASERIRKVPVYDDSALKAYVAKE